MNFYSCQTILLWSFTKIHIRTNLVILTWSNTRCFNSTIVLTASFTLLKDLTSRRSIVSPALLFPVPVCEDTFDIWFELFSERVQIWGVLTTSWPSVLFSKQIFQYYRQRFDYSLLSVKIQVTWNVGRLPVLL